MSRRGILCLCAAIALLALATAVVLTVQKRRPAPPEDTAEAGVFTPFHRAAEKGFLNSARTQLEKGQDVNVRDHLGRTPLHYAACEGEREMAVLLLDAGGLVDARGHRGWTPLHMAAAMGHAEVAELLLERGAALDPVDSAGLTPLHQAAAEGHGNVIRVLLAHGAAANVRDNLGWTPLQHASYEGRRGAAKLLLENGAEASDSRRKAPPAKALPAAPPALAARPGGAPRNVILIVVDALRPDRLGCYGYGRDTSPHLDALAREGVVFTDAMSQGAMTIASLPVLMTGRRFGAAGMVRVQWYGMDSHPRPGPEVPLLGGLIRDQGYDTACISAHGVVPREIGLDRSFDHFDLSPAQKAELHMSSAADLNLRTFEWLEGRHDLQRPFFLYLHYMEPHLQYRPPGEFCVFGRPGYTARDTARNARLLTLGPFAPVGVLEPGQRVTDEILSAQGLSRRDIERLSDLYDGEILCVDHYLGQLFQRLKELGLYETSLIIVTADHGEAFLEHATVGHGQVLYQELIHVPLIIRGPGLPGGRAIDELVELVDIAPTILEALRTPLTTEMCGRSFYQALSGKASITDDIGLASAGERNWALRSGPLKLIVSPEGSELYDLSRDPGETTDLAPSRPDQVRRLSAMLEEVRQRQPPSIAVREAPTPRQLEALKALGYLK